MLLLLLACGSPSREPVAPPPAPPGQVATPATFVGSSACRDCHAAEHAAWAKTDHAFAQGGPGAVQGDLEEEEVAALVATHPVEGTLGGDPLQQLLVKGEGGRLQVLPLAWDTRAAEQGGQRWFAPSEETLAAPAGSALHWAHPDQSWTSQCAACHVTGLDRRYDIEADAWAVSWAEDGVGCEACHGPGSTHVATRAALAPVTAETCAPCHALATPLTADVAPQQGLDDGWRLAPAVPPWFQADGRQRLEAFTWNSFQLSGKAAAGLTCTHCHDAHGTGLKQAAPGLCLDCHPAVAGAEHEAGTGCVACHMPTATFMGIDARPDHRFLVPSPAVDVLVSGDAAARLALAADPSQPVGLRQAAVARAAADMGPALLPALDRVLAAEDAQVRAEGLALLTGAPKAQRVARAAPLLADPARVVRIQAAMLVVDAFDAELGVHAADRPRAELELKQFFRARWDLTATRVQRAELRERAGDPDGAAEDYRAALARDPDNAAAAAGLRRVQSAAPRSTPAGDP